MFLLRSIVSGLNCAEIMGSLLTKIRMSAVTDAPYSSVAVRVYVCQPGAALALGLSGGTVAHVPSDCRTSCTLILYLEGVVSNVKFDAGEIVVFVKDVCAYDD